MLFGSEPRGAPALAVLAIAAAGLIGCGEEPEVEAAPVARPVSSLVVGQSFSGRMTFPGTVQAADRAELSFRVSGPLIALPAEEGMTVGAGRLLARIDPRDYEIAATEARAAFQQAEADAERFKRLYEREAIPLADLEVRLATRDVARARYDQALADLRDTELRAPFAGQIGRRYVQNFEDVQARQVVMSLHDISQVEVVIAVPEGIMATVREGQDPTIAVTFDMLRDRSYPAEVAEFAVNADPNTQTFAVTVSLPQPEEINVLPGMTGTVVISNVAAPAEGGTIPITVPATSVFADPDGGSNVWVVDEGAMTVTRRAVRVGPVTGTDEIFVLEGLVPGERVVTAGVAQLREGFPIRLMER
jgi:RND family efflux transporter MFP subunit